MTGGIAAAETRAAHARIAKVQTQQAWYAPRLRVRINARLQHLAQMNLRAAGAPPHSFRNSARPWPTNSLDWHVEEAAEGRLGQDAVVPLRERDGAVAAFIHRAEELDETLRVGLRRLEQPLGSQQLAQAGPVRPSAVERAVAARCGAAGAGLAL
eukprot:2901994-Pleurochrysis_carterae.AAC.8